MSHEGKMRRGEFYSNKNPKAENLKADVTYFLENSKPKEEPKIEEEPKEGVKPKEKKKDASD